MSKLPFFYFFHLFSFFILSSRFLPLPFLSSPFPLPFSILIHLVIHRFLPHGLPRRIGGEQRTAASAPPRLHRSPPSAASTRLPPTLSRRPRFRGMPPPPLLAPSSSHPRAPSTGRLRPAPSASHLRTPAAESHSSLPSSQGHRREGEAEPGGATKTWLDPPPLWEPFWASCAASGMELLQNHLFGRAPGGAVAGAGAMPKRPLITTFAFRPKDKLVRIASLTLLWK
jgi:hypothetical protein